MQQPVLSEAGLARESNLELTGDLTGARKAAIFLMIMGEDFTSRIFKHLDASEIKAVG
ncbi:MAG: hypothetical protein JRJ02_12635, partial [Deltaproteobacteria bacterium]|nr:hypothetical protein [Deltaproteobacteria bacterium]